MLLRRVENKPANAVGSGYSRLAPPGAFLGLRHVRGRRRASERSRRIQRLADRRGARERHFVTRHAMSTSQSHLDDYGYDVVVAVMQDSINDAIVSYFHQAQPLITKCWTLDDDNNTVEIGYDELKQKTGIDPFALGPDQDKNKAALDKLAAGWLIPGTKKSRWFHIGFQAQMGKPPGFTDEDMPDPVTLGTDVTTIKYQLLCSKLVVVALHLGPHKYNWMSLSQPPKNPWIFRCNVNLALHTDGGNLTPDAQKRVNALTPDTFSIQQLLFELGADTTFITPDIKDDQGQPLAKNSPLYVKLQEMFINLYFAEAKKAGSPILRLTTYANAQQAKTAPSPLPSMGFNLSPSPDSAKPGQATLNYLTLIDNTAKLPAVKPFTWNWIDEKNAGAESGVFALRRGHFAKWLADALHGYVQGNCWRAHNLNAIYVDGGIGYGLWISNPDLNNLKNVTWSPPGSSPATEEYRPILPATGSALAGWTWKSERLANAGHWSNSAITCNCYFNMSVAVDTTNYNALIVDEWLIIYVYIEHYLSNWGSGNIIDRRVIRSYGIDAADDGTLVVRPGKELPGGHDKSFDPSEAWSSLANNMKQTLKHIWENVHKKTDPNFGQLPLTALQQNVFPNGRAFHFKNPVFSQNQDLVAQITYRGLS
jgi:hypothetical protein